MTLCARLLKLICCVAVISIPMMVLSQSLMSRSQKLSYAGFLCLSVVMVIIALIRLIGTLATTRDTNKGSAPIWGTFWEMVEACIAVIMACCLTFRAALSQNANTKQRAAHQDQLRLRSASLWDRLLSTLHFRTRYRRSPSGTGEEGAIDLNQGHEHLPIKDHIMDHHLPTANITKPTLGLSRLRTLFGSLGGTHSMSENSLVTRGTINVDTEFDLRELDYHEVRRQEVPSSAGSGAVRTQCQSSQGGSSFR